MPPVTESDSRSNALPIVGVGASAGGLEAFLEFFKAVHSPVGMSFVLVTHLEPHHESQLATIIAGVTSLPVVHAKDGDRAETDHIYVLPPDAEIEIAGG